VQRVLLVDGGQLNGLPALVVHAPVYIDTTSTDSTHCQCNQKQERKPAPCLGMLCP
jgi:hypothetical protein